MTIYSFVIGMETAPKSFFNNKDTNWLFCLARAQYILTKSEKEHEAMYESLKNSERALHLNPSDKTILYNLALVQQSYAQQIADLSLEQRDSISMHCAIRHLECGQRTFRAMVHVDEHTLYDKKIVKQRERYGETLHTQLERKLTEQIRFEEEKRQKFEFAKKKREEEAAAEKEKCRLEQTEKEKMKEARRRWMRKVREDNRMRASRQVDKGDMDEEKKAKRRNRKRKERAIEEEEEKIEKKKCWIRRIRG